MPTKKVRYTQPLLGEANAAGYLIAVPGASVLIRQDGVECDVFADNDGTALTNPVPTGVPVGTAGVDVRGTLLVYLDPGSGYDGVATVGNESSTFPIGDISPAVEDVADAAALAAVAAAAQPVDADLTAIAGLATTAYGRTFLTLADATAARAATGAAPATGPFAPTITGATSASRYVGGTAAGAPVTGTFAVGDYVIDQTGKIWICTAAGTPGTWVQGGGADATKVPLTQTATTGTPVPVFKVQPDVAARGPFAFTVGDSLFNSTRDFVGYLGYNAANGGGRYLNTEHSFAWVHESDYEVGAGTHWAESYTEYRNKTGTGSFRPWFLAIDKATDIIQEHSFSGAPFTFKTQTGTAVFDIGADGVIRSYGIAGEDLTWEAHAASGRTPAILGLSGATERFRLAGNATYQAALSVGGGSVALFQYSAANGASIAVGGDAFGAAAALFSLSGTNPLSFAIPTLRVVKLASQVGALADYMDSDNATKFCGVSKNGYPYNRKTSAPADADLAAGEMMLWFDATNGAAKLMIKAKQADGTVRTGSVTLS